MVQQGAGSQYLLCIYLKHIQVTACYCSSNISLKSLSSYAAISISRIQYGPELVPYNTHHELDVIKHAFYMTTTHVRYMAKMFNTYFASDKVTAIKSEALRHYVSKYCPRLTNIIEGNGELPITKVSAQHLRHVSVHELRRLDKDVLYARCFPVLKLAERLITVGAHEALISGLLVWAMTLEGHDRTLMNYSSIWTWQFKSVDEFFKRVKSQFSLKLKALQNTTKYDLAAFFEFEVLVNRGVGEVNWVEEREHRTKPNMTQYSTEEITREAKKLFSRVKSNGKRPQKSSWDSFWRQRWKWAPTGTYHSQYTEDDEFKAKDRSIRHKLYALCRMPHYKFDHFLKRSPECRAWRSTKYEWGKQRAIYGVDITNFTLSSFAMLGAEELISDEFPIGPTANTPNVHRRVKETLRNGVPFCFDFEDFNSQHQNEHMAAVLYAYADVFRGQLTEEQNSAINWTACAIDNTYIKDVDDSWYKTRGTLMSGWRLTTFMNTILNKIYVTLADPHNSLVTLHNGDDVLAAVSKLSQVQNFMRNAANKNVRFQASKCFLASIAEFLRIDHRGKKGAGKQYLTRAVATYVHGPTETIVPNDLRALVSSITTRENELLERGANTHVVSMLSKSIREHVSKIWNVDVDVLDIIARTHQVFGGTSSEISNLADKHTIQMIEQYREGSVDAKVDHNQTFPGAYDYAKHVCNTVVDMSMFTRVYKSVRKTIVHNSISKRFGVSIKKQISNAVSNLKMLKSGTLRGKFPVAKADLARAYNVPLYLVGVEAKELDEVLSCETDKLTALRILL